MAKIEGSFSSLDEAIASIWEQPPVQNISFENEGVLTQVNFADDGSWWADRDVDSITISKDVKRLNLTSYVPPDVKVRTYSGMLGHYKYGPQFPAAETGKTKDGQIVICINPKIFDLPSGALIFLHETGHAWDMKDAKYKDAGRMYELLRKNDRSIAKVEIEKALREVRASENSAWQYSLAKYREVKASGFDLAPKMSEEEIDGYPQWAYDRFYNRELALMIEYVDIRHKLLWKHN